MLTEYMKRYCFLLPLFVFFASKISAQDSLNNVLHSLCKSFEMTNGKYLGGKYKGQIVKGHRNGMGFVLNKDNFFYAGDFYRGDISGMGIIIMPKGIKGCPECTTYVGSWENGHKTGFGRCYNDFGDLIYQGLFSNDLPQGEFPNIRSKSNKRFNICDLGDKTYYVGEFYNGIADGKGIIIYNDGGIWQSDFKDGTLNGIGLYCAYNGSWQTLNVKGEEIKVVTSSDDYEKNAAIRRENAVLPWSRIGEVLSEVAQSLSDSDTSNSVEENTSAIADVNSSNSSVIRGATHNYQLEYSRWERLAERHFNSLTNLGYRIQKNRKTGGGTSASMNSGNYVQMKRSLREAQQEMSRIRRQASQNGVNIRQSRWETAVVKY